MGAAAACLADKLGLALAIGLPAMTTLATGATGVARIDRRDRYTRQGRLVGQEAVQLPEAPTTQPIPRVCAPSRDPLANALEVFKRNPAVGASGTRDDLLADDVIL